MTFEDLRKLATGYQPAMLFLTALEFGVFDALAEGELDAEGLAQKIGADARATEIACDALCALGILAKAGGKYKNSPEAARFLAKNSAEYRGSILRHIRASWADWAELDRTWRTGGARCARKDDVLPSSAQGIEDFILGMENMTRDLAPLLAARLPVAGKKAIADLGAGPGNYVLAFAAAAPGARVTHFDLPPTSAVAKRFIAGKPGAERVTFREGNFVIDDLGGPYDFIWLSQVLHMLSDAQAEGLVRKAAQTLSPGGVLAVHEHFLDAEKTSPVSAALFGAHMLAVTKEGRAYSFEEVEGWMRAAGLAPGERIDYGGPSRVLLGTK